MPDRRIALRDAASRAFDLIVIGGGINGAGIARDAALRGLSVALIERHDFGSGTTWRSTKLIHGGLRYLEHHEWRLVFEGLRERAVLLRAAPHLVRPLEFLVPVFRGGRYSRRVIQAGLVLYDLLSWGKDLPGHRTLSADEVAALEPAINRRAITGGFAYFDAQVALPERLCLENVLGAQAAGAVAFNYLEVMRLIVSGGRVQGVVARDGVCGDETAIRGRVIVNAAGPWVDEVLARGGARCRLIDGTRGSHIVVDLSGAGPRHAIYAEAGSDGRPFFIIPWRGRHLIGTTDDRFEGDPAAVLPGPRDVEYLCHEATRVLPGAPLRPENILYVFAGVRPLPRSKSSRVGAVTRRHFVRTHDAEGLAGLVTIIGGKLTSYRRLAEQTVDLACRLLDEPAGRSNTARLPLVPGTAPRADDPLTHHLASVYGARADTVRALARLDPALAAPLCPHGPDIAAQAVHAVRHEGARTVADVLLRRTPAGWNPCRGIDAAPATAALLSAELGWDDQQTRAAVAAYRDEVDATLIPGPGALCGQ